MLERADRRSSLGASYGHDGRRFDKIAFNSAALCWDLLGVSGLALVVVQLKHHALEFLEVDLPVAVLIKLFYQLLPVLVWYLLVFVSKNVFEFPWGDLPIGVHVE